MEPREDYLSGKLFLVTIGSGSGSVGAGGLLNISMVFETFECCYS